MIKLKECYEFMQPYKFTNKGKIAIHDMKSSVRDVLEQTGHLVSVGMEEISTGVFSDKIEGLVITNVEHQKDYLKIVIFLKSSGNTTFINIMSTGSSPQLKKANIRESSAASASGQSASYKIGNAIGTRLSTLGLNKDKLDSELLYYETIKDALAEAFEGE